MHNHWKPIPCPPPYRPECGDPIVGKIVNGRTYPYGCVKEEDYTADKTVLDNKISEIEDQLSTKCDIRIQETEPIENSVLWIRPVQTGLAPLMLGENTGEGGVLVTSNGTTKKALNVVENEADLSPGDYSFENNKNEAIVAVKAGNVAKFTGNGHHTEDYTTATGLISTADKFKIDNMPNFYVSSNQPQNLTENDLWVQIVD